MDEQYESDSETESSITAAEDVSTGSFSEWSENRLHRRLLVGPDEERLGSHSNRESRQLLSTARFPPRQVFVGFPVVKFPDEHLVDYRPLGHPHIRKHR